MITIVDLNVGNVGSVLNMCKKVGLEANITSDPTVILSAQKLVLPGVGAFDYGMRQIENLRLKNALNEVALEKKIPVLGVCLGMQVMSEGSEEGHLPGLGWIQGKCKKFATEKKIPHMGWNSVDIQKENPLMRDPARFYFVHSYFLPVISDQTLGSTQYGETFASVVNKKNIYGVQFHPEKSHQFGMKVFQMFGAL